MARGGLILVVAVVALGLGAAPDPPHANEPPRPLMGFAPSNQAVQLTFEEKMAGTITRASLSDLHKMVSARPHLAGTPGGKAIADAIATKLRAFGLQVDLDMHSVHLSYPKRIRVSLSAEGTQRDLPVTEPVLAPDENAAKSAGLLPGFVAYSASGRVRGRAVYVNYGLPADYDALKAAGVDVKGAIVVARYGRSHRAVKVFTAEQRGARGIVIYSDPADDGSSQGAVWPSGPWRHPQFIQRGNAKYSWYWHGDALTPGYACGNVTDCEALAPENAPTLPKIPAVALSASATESILRAIGGQPAPPGFQGGHAFAYSVGGGAEIELDVEMESGPRPIYNVIGRIDGGQEKDQWVLVGTHHDAWTYGGVDPGSACAALLELARVLGAARKRGWQPRRTIVFGFWDAEEYGLLGSTEFAERHARELREKAVAYINSDLYMAGGLRAGGTASLRDFVAEVARDVASPAGARSVAEQWRAEAWGRLPTAEKSRGEGSFRPELDPLGSGADFVPFQTHLGLPALSLEFGGASYGSYGVYHSNYDTRWFMEAFGDPGWRYGPALVELLGRAVTRLASSEVLPYRYSHLGSRIREYLERAERLHQARGAPAGFDALHKHVTELRETALEVERASAKFLQSGRRDSEKLRRANHALARVEKSFAREDEAGPRGTWPRWYRHVLYGWNIYALYAGQTLPALNRALETGDAVALAAEQRRLEQALVAARTELRGALAALQ